MPAWRLSARAGRPAAGPVASGVRPDPLPHRLRVTGGTILALTVCFATTVPPQALRASDAITGAAALEEVIVTARKLPERLRDIPLSVQVLTAEELERTDLSGLFDLQYQVPGLVLNTTGMWGAGLALRGVASQGGTDGTVAAHFNGVYLGSSAVILSRMFDLERIEVLKGPQGTLYGRNATGGTLNFITHAPEPGFGAAVEAAYGSFETRRFEGQVNVGGDELAGRLAFVGSEGDGFIRNTVDQRRFGESDYRGLRGSLRWQPTDALRVDLVAQRVDDDGGSTELWLPNPSFLPDPNDVHLTTVTVADPYLRFQTGFAGLTVEYDLGWATARSITGYADSETNNIDDCAGMPFLRSCVRGVVPLRYAQWSEELQLASTGGGRTDWLAGAYFFSGDSEVRFFQVLPALNPLPLNNGYSTTDDQAWALFGQATRQLADHWSITGGLRYSYEESDVSQVGTGLNDALERVEAGDDWDRVSWRLDLDYAALDGLLVYAGLSTGFKSGGISTVVLADGGLNDFEPEDLLAYELGVKLRLPERALTLDASVFYYDFEDLQVSSVYVIQEQKRVVSEVENAARAEVVGLDLAVRLGLGARAAVSAGFVWLPTREFVDYTSPRTGTDLSGYLLSRAPEWSALAAFDYGLPLARYGTLSARVEYAYRSAFYFTKENEAIYSEGDYGLLNLLLRFERADARWYAFVWGRNLTDEDYLHQVFLQAAPGYPVTWEAGLGFRF